LRISTIFYIFKQGFKNIWHNLMFSIASIATMGACIFLFGLFFSILVNFQYIVRNAETNVTITVLFEEGLDQGRINEIGELINARDEVVKVDYKSAVAAWDEFRVDYLEGDEKAARGFGSDNPLAKSASYEVYVDTIESQNGLVSYVEGLQGVRTVNRSEAAMKTLSTFNRLLGYVSAAIILILLAVLAVVALVWYWPRFKVEWEYVFCDGQLDFDRIQGGEKRKTILRIELENADVIAPMH